MRINTGVHSTLPPEDFPERFDDTMERDRGMDDHLVYRNETENARPKTRICWNQWEALVLFATISFMANIYHFLWSNHIATNRSPDMLDATSANQYESRVFTGALTYNKSTRRAVRLQDGPVEYFGPPTEAVDIAWEDLLHGNSDDADIGLKTTWLTRPLQASIWR